VVDGPADPNAVVGAGKGDVTGDCVVEGCGFAVEESESPGCCDEFAGPEGPFSALTDTGVAEKLGFEAVKKY